MKLTIEVSGPRLPERRRTRILTVAVLALTMVVPASVLASHVFTDVPTSMSGHAAIGAVRDAGITVGCTPTTYCPTAPVTREQMAIFLQRGLPRVAGAQDLVATELTATEKTINTLTLRVGGNAGGTQFVKTDVAFTGEVTDATGCPCTVYVYITSSGGASSEGTNVTVDSEGWFNGLATLTFPAATGATSTITARAVRDGTGDISLYADMSAISGAFGSQGTDIADSSSSSGRRGR